MRHDEPIRRRPDGSIDTDWYCAIGRRERARQARRMLDARPMRRVRHGLIPWVWR